VPVGDALLGEGFCDPRCSVAVADNGTAAVLPAEIGDLSDNSAGIERRPALIEAIEDSGIAVAVSNGTGETVTCSAAGVRKCGVLNIW
jgi:hypothetical protein